MAAPMAGEAIACGNTTDHGSRYSGRSFTARPGSAPLIDMGRGMRPIFGHEGVGDEHILASGAGQTGDLPALLVHAEIAAWHEKTAKFRTESSDSSSRGSTAPRITQSQ